MPLEVRSLAAFLRRRAGATPRHLPRHAAGWTLTGEAKYARWRQMVHDWSFAHFPDPEFGGWHGDLHRDDRVSVRLKGNLWKGPFHLPRMLWFCWKILEPSPAK